MCVTFVLSPVSLFSRLQVPSIARNKSILVFSQGNRARVMCTLSDSSVSTKKQSSSESDSTDSLLQKKGYNAAEDQVILFDGVCNMCNTGINTILNVDKNKIFKFAALQGEGGRALLRKYGCKEDLSTMVYIDKGKVYSKSDAPIMIGKRLGGALGGAAWLVAMSVPRVVRNWLYSNVIAKYRYNILGVRESCRVADPGMEERFLD